MKWAELLAIKDRIEQLEAENVALKNVIRRGRHDLDGCVCRFAEDGETPVKECQIHAALRAENAELKAALKAYSEPVWKCPKCSAYTRQGYICNGCKYDPTAEQTDE